MTKQEAFQTARRLIQSVDVIYPQNFTATKNMIHTALNRWLSNPYSYELDVNLVDGGAIFTSGRNEDSSCGLELKVAYDGVFIKSYSSEDDYKSLAVVNSRFVQGGYKVSIGIYKNGSAVEHQESIIDGQRKFTSGEIEKNYSGKITIKAGDNHDGLWYILIYKYGDKTLDIEVSESTFFGRDWFELTERDNLDPAAACNRSTGNGASSSSSSNGCAVALIAIALSSLIMAFTIL